MQAPALCLIRVFILALFVTIAGAASHLLVLSNAPVPTQDDFAASVLLEPFHNTVACSSEVFSLTPLSPQMTPNERLAYRSKFVFIAV